METLRHGRRTTGWAVVRAIAAAALCFLASIVAPIIAVQRMSDDSWTPLQTGLCLIVGGVGLIAGTAFLIAGARRFRDKKRGNPEAVVRGFLVCLESRHFARAYRFVRAPIEGPKESPLSIDESRVLNFEDFREYWRNRVGTKPWQSVFLSKYLVESHEMTPDLVLIEAYSELERRPLWALLFILAPVILSWLLAKEVTRTYSVHLSFYLWESPQGWALLSGKAKE